MHQIEDHLSSSWRFKLLNLIKRSTTLTQLSWKSLRLYQTITGIAPDEHAQLRDIEPAVPPPRNGKRVLLFSLRGWTTHLAWETTIARALHLRNAQTLTILCDRLLPACEPRTSIDDFDSTCARCARQSSRFLAATGLPHRWLSAFVTPDEVTAFQKRVADLPLADLQAFEAGGLPIGQLVAASVNRHLLQGQVNNVPEHVAAYRRFVAAGLTAHTAIGRLLDSYQPEVVFAMNGVFYAEAILLAMARARAISVWTYERGKKVNAIIMAHNEPVIKQDFEAKWRERAQQPLTPAQAQALDEYMQSRASGNVGIERLWQTMTGDKVTGTGEKPTAVLFSNVLWDTAVYNSDIAFDSMSDWIIHTIKWFEHRPVYQLAIRIHPAETRVPFKVSRAPLLEHIHRAVPDLPPNVRVIGPADSFSSYALVENAAVVLAYTSTIGLEAAVGGVPVVVAGRTHYRGKGFTRDPDTRNAWETALAQAFEQGRMSQAQIDLARRYAYLYFFSEIIPFSLVKEAPRSYVTFNYRRNDELRPGQNTALDAICTALLTGAALTNPDA